MGATKTTAYTTAQNELASLLKALAHPARIAILQKLLACNCCVGKAFTEDLDLSQPTISRHLRELKDAGLIQGTVEGTSVSYCIDGRRWAEARALVGAFFAAYGTDGACC